MRTEQQVRADIQRYLEAVRKAKNRLVKERFQHVLEQLRDELTDILEKKRCE